MITTKEVNGWNTLKVKLAICMILELLFGCLIIQFGIEWAEDEYTAAAIIVYAFLLIVMSICGISLTFIETRESSVIVFKVAHTIIASTYWICCTVIFICYGYFFTLSWDWQLWFFYLTLAFFYLVVVVPIYALITAIFWYSNHVITKFHKKIFQNQDENNPVHTRMENNFYTQLVDP